MAGEELREADGAWAGGGVGGADEVAAEGGADVVGDDVLAADGVEPVAGLYVVGEVCGVGSGALVVGLEGHVRVSSQVGIFFTYRA
ncbi:hypothetical protein [Streptomyces sp. adm13(2018)]|uniref:hypothetical protein n=1 Tax=Streptomyces sp. adm13(2018) TaxID=2479007 RepID=UPI0011CD7E2C|nr:hypothetical protein [Streptomyces sp. adm13(2018)]